MYDEDGVADGEVPTDSAAVALVVTVALVVAVELDDGVKVALIVVVGEPVTVALDDDVLVALALEDDVVAALALEEDVVVALALDEDVVVALALDDDVMVALPLYEDAMVALALNDDGGVSVGLEVGKLVWLELSVAVAVMDGVCDQGGDTVARAEAVDHGVGGTTGVSVAYGVPTGVLVSWEVGTATGVFVDCGVRGSLLAATRYRPSAAVSTSRARRTRSEEGVSVGKDVMVPRGCGWVE